MWTNGQMDRRTDGQTGKTKLIVAFRSFANAPKIYKFSNEWITFWACCISLSVVCTTARGSCANYWSVNNINLINARHIYENIQLIRHIFFRFVNWSDNFSYFQCAEKDSPDQNVYLLELKPASLYQNIQTCNFACCFVWVWNLVCHIKGGTQAEGVWEYGAQDSIWAKDGRGNRGVEKTT